MKSVALMIAGMAAVVVASAEPHLANFVAVIVNDSVITFKDVQRRLAPEISFLQRRYAGRPEAFQENLLELQEKAIEELVERELILHEYEKAGYSIPESYIERKIQEDIREYGDRLNLTKTLQARDLTYEQYRERVRERIIIDAMWQNRVPDDPIVSPQQIEEYYRKNQEKFQVDDQVRLRVIVLPKRSDNQDKTAREIAEELLAKIRDGADFAETARTHSDGRRASNGGDWGWMERSVLRKDLADAAFDAPVKEPQLVEADDGSYLLLVEEKQLAHVKPLPEVRQEIEKTLKARKKNRLRQRWIDQLKDKSFLRYFQPKSH